MSAGNPFVYDRPLTPDELIDREAEVEQLLGHARDRGNSRLTAPRRYGKTTLLRRVLADARQEGMHALYVDFYGVISLADVAARLEDAYRSGLEGPLRKAVGSILRVARPSVRAGVPGVSAELAAGQSDDALRSLHSLLDLPKRVFERSGRRSLIAFDEFQDVLGAHESVDGLFRSRIQFHLEEASYVFAGSEPGMMSELFESRDRPLYQQARPLRLERLGDEDLAAYVERRFAAGDRGPGRALDALLDLAAGHPQRAMLLAWHLWHRTGSGEEADEGTWLAARQAAFEELAEGFDAAWRGHGGSERKLLAAVAGGGPPLAAATLAALGLRESTARGARDRLVRGGELEWADRSLRFVDPLFAEWVAAGRRAPD